MAKTEENRSGFLQLKQDLKNGTFSRLYFFYGEEKYLQEHYLSVLRKKTVAGPMEEFNYRRLTEESMSLSALRDAVEAMPMMAEYTLVQVDDFNPFEQDESTREALVEIFSDLPETCCLVFNFDTETYSRNGKMKKLQDCIDQYACQVNFAKQSPSELAEWVVRHFRALGKTIAPDLCQYLIFLTGGSMTTLHSEIEKIAAYSRMPAVSRLDIDTVVEPVLQAVIFDVTDALAAGNYDKALTKLRDVLQTGEEPIAVLAVIGGHFRRLLAAKTVSANGYGADALADILGSNSGFYCRKLMNQADKFQEAFFVQAVVACYEADKKLKRTYDEEQQVLELLLLTLAQEAAR